MSRKVSHTASFASVAKVAETETRFYGEHVSDFLGNLRSRGLFPPPNFDEKLADLCRRKDEFDEYVPRTRERFATEESNLLRDRSEAERLRVYIEKLVRVAEATPSESEVGKTKNLGKSEVDKPKNSAHESEDELSAETFRGTLDKSDAKSVCDMQTVRLALRSPEESATLSLRTLDEECVA